MNEILSMLRKLQNEYNSLNVALEQTLVLLDSVLSEIENDKPYLYAMSIKEVNRIKTRFASEVKEKGLGRK